MTRRTNQAILYSLLVILFVAHNDLWLWNDASIWLGLPAGLTYHILYCAAASLLMLGLVLRAWPDLDDGE